MIAASASGSKPIGATSRRGIINATGTWETPYIPDVPGKDRFTGRQLHTRDYRTAEEFAFQHVIVVGGGISAVQLLDEISRVTTTTWVTRRPPEFRAGPFTEGQRRAAVALVEDRVRRGLPPQSVVSVTGLPLTPAIEAMRERGVLERLPMFSEILQDGVRWPDGTVLHADVILWCTGFRSSLDHLAPLSGNHHREDRMRENGDTGEGAVRASLAEALTFHASFDHGPDADFSLGDGRIYSVLVENEQETGELMPGLGQPALTSAEGQGRFGPALKFTLTNSHVVLFKAARNVAYSLSDFGGTASFWMRVDPAEIP